ncbi:Protein unc-93-like protein, partial [Stegodyphus mimosarum]
MAVDGKDHSSNTTQEQETKSSILITLTTFYDSENGTLSAKTPTTTSAVKIDGDDVNNQNLAMQPSSSKTFIVRNLLVLSFGNFLLFMAFDSLANLQSTMNGQTSVGVVSLAVIYGTLTVSSLFLPTLVIRCLGCKKTLVVCFVSFCPYILANFYPDWSTLIPSAVLCGLVSGPLSAARNTYINEISHRYATLQGASATDMNAWFFSISTAFQQNTEIWGNMISYFVLKDEEEEDNSLPSSVLNTCGADFCDEVGFKLNPNLHPPPEVKRYILVTIYVTLGLTAAFFVSFFLDSLDAEQLSIRRQQEFSPKNILATFRQMLNINQLLLLPLSFYTGLVDGFYNGDYAKAYVACAWGVPHVGVVSICYGVVSALVDSVSGPSVMILGRVTVFIVAATAHFSMFISLTFWEPDPDRPTGFFLIAGVHGIGNGIWLSQLVGKF